MNDGNKDYLEEDDGPWTEAQWEESIALSAIRSAKYGELMETLINDPDRDEIIAQEMGWTEDDDEDPEETRRFIETVNKATQDEEGMREVEEEIRQRKEALAAREDYQRAFAFGRQMHDVLTPLMDDMDPRAEDDFITAYRDSMVVAAKLSGANAMGEDESVLCGNIVYCSKALTAAQSSVAALRRLRESYAVEDDVVDPLITEGLEVARLVEAHIEQLRKRVWWQ